ncbi:MAG TPA: SOS response-associated peptidase [Micromonosporaceae bacterium]
MCGRYATSRSAADLAALFDADDDTDDALTAAYNVAPTDPVPMVRRSASRGGRVLSVARWGLVPPWVRDPRQGARMINARAETVAVSRAYGPSFARRRCLVPADGWYEWRRREDASGPAAPTPRAARGRQAYFMTPADGAVLAFAGLWSVWGDGDDRLLTTSVVTMPALGPLAEVHDRMPLVLPPQRWRVWLDGSVPPEDLLAPPPPEFLDGIEIRPVGPAVGDVRNDGPDLVRPIPAVTEAVELTLF